MVLTVVERYGSLACLAAGQEQSKLKSDKEVDSTQQSIEVVV